MQSKNNWFMPLVSHRQNRALMVFLLLVGVKSRKLFFRSGDVCSSKCWNTFEMFPLMRRPETSRSPRLMVSLLWSSLHAN